MTPRERAVRLREAILPVMAHGLSVQQLNDLFDVCEAAIIADRRELLAQVRDILHDEGWLGRSEQRIASLVDPMPEGDVEAVSNGDK